MAFTMEAPTKYQSIDERFDWIIAYMVLEDMFVHNILMLMEKRAVTDCATMGVCVQEASLLLVYNLEFVKKLTDPELRYILTHEVYHVAFHHVTIRRPEDPSQHEIWNIAADLAINSLIPDTGSRHMPKGELEGQRPEKYGFEPKLSMEMYLQLLRDQDSKDKKDGKGKGDGKSNGQGGGKGDKDGKGQSKGFDDHKGWRESEVMKEIVRQTVERMALDERSWGSTPGDVKSMILAAQRSEIAWHKLLRHYLGLLPSTKKEPTFRKPNRRYGWPYCGDKREHVDRKLVAMDSSGSISDSDLALFISECNRLAEVQPVDLQIFDCTLQGPIIPFNKRKASLGVPGRGGTDFQMIMDLAEKRRYQSVIILTDGCAPAPTKPAFVKDVIWVIIGSGNKPPVDWGRVVMVPDRTVPKKSK
jgi:predicted metal-dependent peptidase